MCFHSGVIGAGPVPTDWVIGNELMWEKANSMKNIIEPNACWQPGKICMLRKARQQKKNWRFDAKGKTCLKPEEKVDEKKTHKAIDAVLHAKKRMNMGDIPPYEDDLAH